MKKKLSILLLIIFINVFKINAQINQLDSSISEQHKMADLLLKKSKRQETTAWILISGGAGVLIAGSIIGTNAVKNYSTDDPFNIFPRGSLAGAGMILGGLAAMAASVPFFIASDRNKRKANLIFQNESQSFLHQLHKRNNYSVGVSLTL